MAQGLSQGLAAGEAGPPSVQAERLADQRLVVRDTRRVAMEPEVTLSREASELLLRVEKPPPLDAVAARPGLGALLQRGLVVQHEGMLVSVVVR